jgi:hypothetical protein
MLILHSVAGSALVSVLIRIQLFTLMLIRIQKVKPMRIPADPDQDPGQSLSGLPSQKVGFGNTFL